MPKVEETLASYLSPESSSSTKSPVLPTKPVRTTSALVGDQGKTAVPGIVVVHEKARSIRQVCLLNEHAPSLLANQYSTSQPLLLQPQPVPHKHETEVANPQYLLHWH